MSVKSTTCSSKNGPLTEYQSEAEALKGAQYVLSAKGMEFYPYN